MTNRMYKIWWIMTNRMQKIWWEDKKFYFCIKI